MQMLIYVNAHFIVYFFSLLPHTYYEEYNMERYQNCVATLLDEWKQPRPA